MLKQRAWTIFFLLIFLIIAICFSISAAELNIYLNGQDVSTKLETLKEDDQVLVQARGLADSLQLETRWIRSIKTLEIKKDDKKIKMMADSPYLQMGEKTVKTKSEMKIVNGHTYIPLKKIVEAFGYVTEFEESDNALYILNPKSSIKKVSWRETGQEILVEMDKITPYRIKETDDPKKLILEIDKTSLAPGFKETISNNNFYFEINRVENRACLQFVISSKYPLSFHRNGVIKEEDNNLILKFLSRIKSIKWQDKSLAIRATGEINKPDVFFLKNPRRMVLDIPSLRLSEYKLDFEENKWVKDIKVSQFKNDPLILRVVLELKEGKYLNPVQNGKDNILLLKPGRKTRIGNLSVSENEINFSSEHSVKPELFTLNNPDRLVIDIYNAYREEDFPENVEVENGLIKKIRSSRFKEGTVRLVADLKEATGYDWKQVKNTTGEYRHKIILENKFENISLINQANYTNINIGLSGKVNYKVKKFSYPDRIVVDLEGIDVSPQSLPEPRGIIKDIRTNNYSEEGLDIIRIVFELNKFESYDVISDNPDDSINIALAREKLDERENLIILDAGHGGFDPGAIGTSGLEEKVVNLDIALRVKKLLKKSDYNVLLTREKDNFISLKGRVRLANQKNARVFVSIHSNSSRGFSEGTEAFLAPAKTGDSLPLAESIHNKLVDELKLKDRGIKKENFYVIKYTEMPAVLVEVAFLSNPHEESLLENDLFRERAASAIEEGILNYMQKFEK
ncbi:MAG: N-acetylmuramoyl-L-alanine amidase [Halanaerobiales bacterium]|nr:N-acetylmuramoyl-L-alanine amidase [Halanaerobiales bacterium]